MYQQWIKKTQQIHIKYKLIVIMEEEINKIVAHAAKYKAEDEEEKNNFNLFSPHIIN